MIKKLNKFNLIIILLLSCACVYFLSLNILSSVLLFFVPAIVYLLSLINKNKIKESLTGSFVFGFLFTVPFEFVNLHNNSWYYFNNEFIIRNFIFGIPFEVILWYFLWFLFTILVYQSFENLSFKLNKKHLKISILLSVLMWVILIFIKTPTFSYPYLIIGVAALFPAIYFIIKNKNFKFRKFLVPTLVVSTFLFIMESIALIKEFWIFNGNYIYSLNLFGKILPIEELIIWIFLSPFVVICYFELFIDDGK